MSDRFKQLYSIEPNQYQAEAPVLIVAGALLQDTVADRVLVLLKMRSLSLKKIKAVSVIIQPLDILARKLGDVISYQYLDLQVNRADVFGQKQPIFMEEKSTRQFSVLLKEIAFEDNSVWEADNSDTFTIEEPVSLQDYFQEDGELVKQYRCEYGANSVVFPKDEGKLWICSCGEFNTSLEKRCCACGNEKEKLFSFNLSDLEKKKEDRLNAESYENALKLKNKRTNDSLIKAVSVFKQLGDYKDSVEQITICEAEIEVVKAEEEKKRKAEEEKRKAEEERLLEEERQAKLRKERARKKAKIIAIVASACVVCVAIGYLVINVMIPSWRYNSAIKLMEKGKYEEAYALLEKLGKNDVIASNKYDRAVALIDSGEYEQAYLLLSSLDGKEGADKLESIKSQYESILLSKAQVGEYVEFGSYEQDANISNGKENIEWLVLAREGEQMLVISRYALDCQQYNTSSKIATWETCSLRKWLNETFIENAFSSEEQVMIQNTTVTADKNPRYITSPGKDTTDRVFLLSISEINEYFSSDEARSCVVTDYAIAQGAYAKDKTGQCWWWLRSPGNDRYLAADVNLYGSVHYDGDRVDDDKTCVRPALWISLES